MQPVCCSPPPKGVLELISPWITWALVILGWYIVHASALKRARRQEDLDLIAGIAERVDALRDRGIAYYTQTSSSDPKARGEEAHVKRELQSIVGTLQLLRQRRPKRYELSSEVILFRKALTGGTFEASHRVTIADGDPVVQNLWVAADTLLTALRLEFEKAHRW